MLTIVFLSHTALSSTFKVGSFQLAREYARLGHEVVHVSPPLSGLHLLRIAQGDVRARAAAMLGRLRRVKGEALDVVPFALMPWGLFNRGREPNPWVLLPTLTKTLRRFGVSNIDILAVDEPRFAKNVPDLRYRKLIYRATDLYASLRRDERISKAERRVCSLADLVIGTSEPVASHLSSLGCGSQPILIENGVDFEAFAPARAEPTDLARIPRLRLVYVGATDDRFSVEDVRTAAKANPTMSFVLIGPASRKVRSTFAGSENVYLLGPRRYEEIPAYMQHCDIGLLPLSQHPANRGRSPMKLYEYAACGLPVFATLTPELHRRQLPFVFLHEVGNLAEALARCLAEAERLDREEIKAVAARQSWRAIAARILGMALERVA